MATCYFDFTQQKNIAAYLIFMIAVKKHSNMLSPEVQHIKVFSMKSSSPSLIFTFN